MLAAPLAGLVVGAVVWLAFAHGAAAFARVDALHTRALAIEPPAGPPPSSSGTFAADNPIFALTTGPKAVAEAVVVLTGVQRTPVHSAALLSINGKAPEWIELGQTKDDVTLSDVQADKAVVDTPTGLKEVRLGDRPSGAPTATAPVPVAPSATGAPPGFHMPPPPASAPGP